MCCHILKRKAVLDPVSSFHRESSRDREWQTQHTSLRSFHRQSPRCVITSSSSFVLFAVITARFSSQSSSIQLAPNCTNNPTEGHCQHSLLIHYKIEIPCFLFELRKHKQSWSRFLNVTLSIISFQLSFRIKIPFST